MRRNSKGARADTGVIDGLEPPRALPELTPPRTSMPSVPSRAKLLGSMRPIGVVFLEQSTRLGSPLRSPLWRGKGVFHSSMPCA